MFTWANFFSQVFNGLALGALLALISSGLTIIYGTLGVLNLAHGAMFMLGGYAGFVAYSYTGSFTVAVAVSAGGACGARAFPGDLPGPATPLVEQSSPRTPSVRSRPAGRVEAGAGRK